jgi:fatty-acyl-CoA synthase
MNNQGLGSWTVRRARKTPQRTAVVHGDWQWTYGELHHRTLRLAHGLRRLGVERGDRVAYLGPNHPSYLETLFATGMLGAVFLPLNTRLAERELAHQMADAAPRVLIHPPDRTVPTPAHTQHVALGDPYDDLIVGSRPQPIDEPVSLDDPCLIMYTSGTTGVAKGAVLTHGNITWNSINVLVDADLASDEVTLVTAPLFHTASLNMTCLPTLLKGGTVVLEPAFDPVRVLELIESQRITLMFAVPTMYDILARTPGFATADLSSLRTLFCGGAPVPDSTIRTYLDRGLTFVQGYGMTEAAPGVLLLDRTQTLAKAGSAGVPHFFTDVRVVGPASTAGSDLTGQPPGEKGEVLVQGPNVMAGYWGQPEASANAFSGGWFRSGDIAVTDDDGYVYIVDRLKDMIISGGENIYPAEVENVLREHPDVLDCAVIGIPDERWGEVGRAVVVARPGSDPKEADLLAFLERQLARYKVPKSVIFVPALPVSAVGKVLKNVVRQQHGS